MKYLITGGEGQLGYDLKEALSKKEVIVLAPPREVLDITNQQEVEAYLLKEKPDIIFHCAAYTAVDKAEEERDACLKVNVEGTKHLVEMAKKLDSTFIYISTDYVFDGAKEGFYTEEDKTNPQSVYGQTKYEGEQLVKTLEKYFIVRISWVFGINGNNFVKTMLRLSETKKELTIVMDQIGSPTYTKDLASLLITMSESTKYGIYHATNEDTCSWAEFATEIFKQMEKDVVVKPIPSSAYPQKAKRPKNSCLSKDKLEKNGFKRLPSWQDALSRYCKELEEQRKKE